MVVSEADAVIALQGWFPGKGYGLFRRFCIILPIVSICLAVSLAVPYDSVQIAVITGASGVFLVCYLIPVINHIMLFCGWCATNESGAILRPSAFRSTLPAVEFVTLPHGSQI